MLNVKSTSGSCVRSPKSNIQNVRFQDCTANINIQRSQGIKVRDRTGIDPKRDNVLACETGDKAKKGGYVSYAPQLPAAITRHLVTVQTRVD